MASPSVSSCFRMRQLPWLLVLAWAGTSAAQTQLVAAANLKEVIVSGTRSEQVSDDLAASIDIISSEDLEKGQVRDIRDLARDLPNVSVKRAPARMTLAGANTGSDGNSGFNIRGRDGNQVLTLIDGIRVPRSYVFAANAFGRDYFDIGLVERVEIIRGPASALYGSDGMAGLVNFITHDPENFLKGGKTIGGRATVGYTGDDKGWNTGGTVAGRGNEVMSWLVSANVSRAKALDNMGTNNSENVNRTTPNPQRDRNGALLGKMVLRPDATQKHELTLEHVQKRSEVNGLSALAVPPYTATSTREFNSFQDMNRNRASLNSQFRLDATLADTLQTALSYQAADSRDYRFERRNAASDRVRDTTYDEKTWQLNVQAGKTLRTEGSSWVQKFTYGFDTTHTDVETLQTGLTPAVGETFPLKRFPDTKESSTAFYIQDEIANDHWIITPGVRYDRYKLDADATGYASSIPPASLNDAAVSPKLGVLFRVTPEWSLFGNYASGFKAPNASQVNAYRESGSFPFYKTIPNPDLQPEKSRNFEVGVRGRTGGLSLDAAVFTGRYKDLIEENVVVVNGNMTSPANALVYQTRNVSDARISGFEVKGDMDWGRFGEGQLSTPFAYGQAKGRNRTTNKGLNSVDPAKFNAGVRYSTVGWEVRMDVTHHAAKKADDVDAATAIAQFVTPSATTLDLSGQWRIRKDLRLNVGIFNLTDKKYWNWADVRGVASNSNVLDAYTQPGRNVRVSLVADF